ncbi:MAG: biotin transporter BioY [Asticcacaulis sp.]
MLTASSYVQVPMQPVPLTLQTLAVDRGRRHQTLAVTVVGAAFGWRLGTATVLAWLAAAMAGLPVLAGVTHIVQFAGPTAGYLAAFPFAAALCGWLASRGWNGERIGLALVSMILGNALCLAMGAAWLSVSLGFDKALAAGVLPFVIGAGIKSAIGAGLLKAFSMWPKRG